MTKELKMRGEGKVAVGRVITHYHQTQLSFSAIDGNPWDDEILIRSGAAGSQGVDE